MTEKITMNKASIYHLSITALFVALTYVFTAFVNIRLPIAANGGLIHLGNVPLFIAAILFGRKVSTCFRDGLFGHRSLWLSLDLWDM